MGAILENALKYHADGWVLHPLTNRHSTKPSPGKKPILPGWTNIKSNNIEELTKWFDGDNTNIGLVCGSASGLIIIDIDSQLFKDELFDGINVQTLKSARTEGRGHIFFKYTDAIKSQKHHDMGFEILSNGSNAVLPPSIHLSGDIYHWMNPDTEVAEFPKELIERIEKIVNRKKTVSLIVGRLRKCFKEFWKNKPDVHGADGREMMLAFCTDLKANGATLEDILFVAKILYQKDFDAGRTETEFNNIDITKTWKCTTLSEKLPSYVLNCDDCTSRDNSDKTNQTTHKTSHSESKQTKSGIGDAPLINYSKDIIDAANMLLDKGDAFKFIVDVWNTKHVGDRGIGEACACAVGATYIKNSYGLHMKPSGQSGKGKSDGSKKFVHLLPDNKKMVGSLSGKAPFYSDDLKEGVIIYSDDARLNEDIVSTIKQATTYFQTTTVHRTVNIKRKGEILTIPPRVSWWMTNVDSFDDDQMGNRFLTMDVDAGPEQDEAVFKHQIECHLKGITDEDITDEVLICRAVYNILNSDTYHIVVPFLKCIEWDNKDNRRNFQMFVDIIEAVTLYRLRQCEKIGIYYLAELQDFERAKKIYNSLVATNTTNLSEIELKIMRFMEATSVAEIMEIAKYINRGRTTTHKYLHGENDKGGLLKKIPGLDCEKITDRQDNTGRSTHKNIYSFQASSSKYGLDSFLSVVGICMDGFYEEVEAEKTRLSALSFTVTSLSPQKTTEKPSSIDIINKYIINNSIMYDDSIFLINKNQFNHKRGESADSLNSEPSDNGDGGDSAPDSQVTVNSPHIPKTAQLQLMRHLMEYKRASYSMVGKIDPDPQAPFTVYFLEAHSLLYKSQVARVTAAIELMNRSGWK